MLLVEQNVVIAHTVVQSQEKKGNNMSENNWKHVCHDECSSTARLKVEGGHLYHRLDNSREANLEIEGSTMCFVPDVDLTRYRAHLRDAYNQGFKDGVEQSKPTISYDLKKPSVPRNV